MNKTEFDEPAIGESGSMARKIQVYEYFLKEIAKNQGMCIYGTSEYHESPTEIKEAFRDGSYRAFEQCANLAINALNSKDL